MDLDEARAFLRENHGSVLATTRQDGHPQLSPVVHAVDDDGRVCISTREPAFKVRNLRRDPHASLCVLNDKFFGKWLQVEGTAEIVPLPAALPMLEAIYRQVAGEHPDWDDFRAAMEREQRVVVRIDIDRAGPDRAG